ncbi:D-amino-acid dehydrogenase [Desulfosarcina ovata subsp. sediminis]|uniref:D-amino-acid dehydrogenase n=1 Tax=Desulfosarcina ovata subsp. sediminis TaxID=885957 RepID=A0A5K8A166_9BACT|nr:FAD-dependent oxidoreductase [Desulfosarcina ovata]BBO86325.1 D-amino-acid dehydrogenase [Desulfosarcina ovata subsp. sediminis]
MSLQNSRHSDVLVIGGGVIGLACAYYLVRDGRSVRIIEQDTVGAGASHGNCGLLFVSDLPPLCVPGAIRHELIRTLRGTSPLTIKPHFDLSLALWLLRFAAHCHSRQRDHAIRARNSILRASATLFGTLFEDERLECDFERRGVLIAFTDPATMEGYQATNRLLAPFGLAARFHDRRSVRTLEPALSDRVCGGWYHPADSHLRPERLVHSWGQAVQQRGGMIEEDCSLQQFETRKDKVTAVITTRGRFTADRFVLAAGAWTPAMARQLGLRIPVQPGKGYSITMQRPAACPTRPCYLYERNMVVTPWKSGYRLGGTMEFSGFDDTLNPRRLANLETSAAIYLKTPVGRPVTEQWTGLRPMCVDDLPIIDRMPDRDNLYIATGHGMLGISTATGTGRLMADMVAGKRPSFDPAPFSIRRFARLG